MLGRSRILNLNSEERSSGSHENANYTINISPDESYSHCCVLQASIPVSYYLVPEDRNTFQVDQGSVVTTVTVPPGNYNSLSFAKKIKTLVNEISPSYVWDIKINNSLTDVNDGKFRYTVVGFDGGSPPDDPKIILTRNLYEQFGFDKNSTNSFVSGALVSKNVVNFVPEQTLYLQSSLVETQQNNSDGLLQELFATNAVAFSFVRYQCTTFEAYSKVLSNRKPSFFNVSLQNEVGDIMNLNGRNITMTILLYNPDNTFDLIKSYLRYTINTIPDK